MVSFAFCSEKCISAIASLQFSLPPFPLPTKQTGTRVGVAEKLPESLYFFLPTIPPSAQLVFSPLRIPALLLPPHTVCSNSAGGKDAAGGSCLGRWGPAALSLARPCSRVCLGWLLSSDPPRHTHNPLHPKQCGCVGEGGRSADWETAEQGCSLKINRCYLCNSKSRVGGNRGERQKKIQEVPGYF